MSEPTIFTKIINRELPSTIVYEDNKFIAIKDIHPQAPVHILIITKEPLPNLETIDINDLNFHASLVITARKIAHQLNIADNYKLLMNVGVKVQDVQHIHLHLLGGWDVNNSTEEVTI